ncbi:alcohol dehydrogenase catalytic domain-containing protein [Nocardia sp. NPDC059239]|uniref:alcohol dehydrogenase catalytic domain-containing protein n=1 Tax=Nocardia sp. NPDC059239 TaxID=3346785 RepID=UPI003681F0D4
MQSRRSSTPPLPGSVLWNEYEADRIAQLLLEPGDGVGVAEQSCGPCAGCQRRRVCVARLTRGVDYDGGWAQYTLAREDTLVPIPEPAPSPSITPATSCPSVTVSTGWKGLRLLSIR